MPQECIRLKVFLTASGLSTRSPEIGQMPPLASVAAMTLALSQVTSMEHSWRFTEGTVVSFLFWGHFMLVFFHEICQQSVYSEEAICGIQGSNRDQNRGGLTERKGYVAKIDRGVETRSGQEINSGGGEAKSRKTIFCH